MGEPLEVELCDLLARGRVSLAELLGVSARELEAVFALGATFVGADRDQDAEVIFAGLVSLFPYDARFLRAWAVTLQRLGDHQRARAVNEAALGLDPEHASARCNLGEILAYLGEHEAARKELELARDIAGEQGDEETQRRAGELLRLLAATAASPQTASARTTSPPAVAADVPIRNRESATRGDIFSLADHRPLPLATSRAALTPIVPDEITATMRRPAPREPGEQPTAISGPKPTPKTAGAEPLRERTVTRTALIPGRRRALELEQAARQAPRREVTQTAIIRRAVGTPLLPSEET